MAGTFGTLRSDSYFTPAEVLDEATSLNSAIVLLGQTAFNDNANLLDDQLAAWDSFVADWRSFWAECNAWDGFVFRAENNTRDNLLNYEATYTSFRNQFAAAGTNASGLPAPTPEKDRASDSLSSALNGAGKALQNISWQLVAGAAIVVVGAVGLLYVARRGGIPV